MKTRICFREGQIALVVVDPAKDVWDCDRLAEMTLYEGTGCWTVTDLRLKLWPQKSQYACTVGAEDYYANIQPESDAERQIVIKLLREYNETADGTIEWCSYNGIVPGRKDIKPSWINYYHPSGFHKKDEGLALLSKMKEFWDTQDNYPKTIENVNRQISYNEMLSILIMHRMGHHEIVEKELKMHTLIKQ